MGSKHEAAPKPQKPIVGTVTPPQPEQPSGSSDSVVDEISDAAGDVADTVEVATDVIGLFG